MAGAAELLRRRQTSRPGTDNSDRAATLGLRRLGLDPAFLPRAVDDRKFDLLDRYRIAFANLKYACCLARRRAEPPGELREVVGRMETDDRRLPVLVVDEIVEVRD